LDLLHFELERGIPVELDLRRNIVKRIAELLETKHMKRVLIQYL
jgi:hypothetical protein